MLVRLFICVLFCLVYSFPSLADVQTKSADQVKLEQANEKILALEKDLAIHKHTLQASLDNYDKRVSDFSILISKQSDHTTWVGIGITILLVLISIVGYVNAGENSKKVAKTEVDKWFESHAKSIEQKFKDQMIELEKRAEIAFKVQDEYFKERKIKVDLMFNSISDLVVEESPNTSNVEKQFQSLQEDPELRKHLIQDAVNEDAEKNTSYGESIRRKIDKLRNKPKDEYNDYDYFITGIDFFKKKQLGSALDAINTAIKMVKPNCDDDRFVYLKSKAVVLEELQYFNEAQKIWSHLIEKYDSFPGRDFKDSVAESKYKNISILRKMERFEDANTAYLDFIDLYKTSTSEVVNELYVRAIFDQALYLKSENRISDAIENYDKIIDEFSNSSNENLKFLIMAARINQDSARNQFIKTPDAINYYSGKIEQSRKCIAAENSKANRIKLIEALASKAQALSFTKQLDEALIIFNEIIELFNRQSDPEVNYLIAAAYNAIGFTCLLNAKRNWADSLERTRLLELGLSNFESAFKLSNDHNSSVILGNKGYALFLLGRKIEAQVATLNCLNKGAHAALSTQLEDAKLDRVDEVDASYEVWIKDLFELENKSAK